VQHRCDRSGTSFLLCLSLKLVSDCEPSVRIRTAACGPETPGRAGQRGVLP
jgi:hypothetical protein